MYKFTHTSVGWQWYWLSSPLLHIWSRQWNILQGLEPCHELAWHDTTLMIYNQSSPILWKVSSGWHASTSGNGSQYVRACPIRDRESDKSGRHIRETIWIRKTDNMNRDEGSYQLSTYGTSSYILTTATGSQSWWRLPTWSRNVDNKVCCFGCLEKN